MQNTQQKLKSAMDLEQHIKGLDLRPYGQIGERKVWLAEAIYKSGKLEIVDKVTAHRLANAFDRYIFLIAYYNNNPAEKDWTNNWTKFSENDSLDYILDKVQTSEPMSKPEKIQILLDLLPEIAGHYNKLKSEAEEKPILSLGQQRLLVIFFILSVAFAFLLSMKKS